MAAAVVGALILACLIIQTRTSAPGDPTDHARTAPADQTTTRFDRGQEHEAPVVVAAENTVPHPGVDADFRAWLGQAERTVDDRALALAKQRHERMRWLMQHDPEQAIAESLSFSEYARTPESLRAYVEQPFSKIAKLQALPVCDLDHDHGAHGGHPGEVHVLTMEGVDYHAGVFGRRLQVGSKEGVSLQGIVLDELAAIREEAAQPLSPEDVQMLADLPVINQDPQRGFATGRPLGAGAVTALAGDRLVRFESREALDNFNQQLASLDLHPGPRTSAELAFALPDLADGAAEGFNFEAVQEAALELASSWTETEKTVFFIRVDFPDLPGASVGQAALEQILDTGVTDNIYDQSLGKTYITAEVSAQVVTLPNTTTYYVDSPNVTSRNGSLHTDAQAAFNALGTGINLGDYDIIGVHFASIGMKSGGLNYSGLASRGGSEHWLQGSTSSETIVHEFGHNYGLQHARAWNTTDGSVLGAGTSVEYGDIADIMGDGPYPRAFFHGQARDLLNWFEDEVHWTDATVGGSGTYRLYQMDDAATMQPMRSLRVTRAPGEYFWLGYRRNFDDTFFDNGAYLVWQRSGESSGWLMDTTPDSEAGVSNDAKDAPLLLGRTFSDSDIHITPIATGGAEPNAWLDVHVEFGPFPANVAPTASISGPTNVVARSTHVYTANASDANGDTLAYYWETGEGAIQLDANAIAQTFNASGVYEIQVTVSDRKGETVLATTTVTVTDPLDNWTQRVSGASGDLLDVCVGGGRLVAVGENYTSFRGDYRYSDDGVNWSGGLFGNNEQLHAVIWDGAQFIAVGQDYNFDIDQWEGMVSTSPNGVTWTKQFQGARSFNDIVFDGSIYVAVGDAGAIFTSTNLTSWTDRSIATTKNFNGVASGNGVLVAVGGQSNSVSPMVYTSSDAINWTDYSNGANTPQALSEIEYIAGRFFSSGFATRLLSSSDDGQSFDSGRDDREQIAAFAYGNQTYFATGKNRDASDIPVTLISLDGVEWTEIASPAATSINDGVFFEDTFILVGDAGEIWQSNAFEGPAIDPFVAWQLENFSMVGDEASSSGDFENDGLPNLYEYFAGGNPTLPDPGLAPMLAWDSGFIFMMPEDINASGVSLAVNKSTDLINWSPAAFTDVSTTPGEVILNVADGPANGAPLFLQVEVVKD